MNVITNYLALLLLLLPTFESKYTNPVKGILYSDGRAVSIAMENGKIADIKRLNSDVDNTKIYLAPGLIDIQINGYMGVDFSGPDLTIEGVRKATKALGKQVSLPIFPLSLQVTLTE